MRPRRRVARVVALVALGLLGAPTPARASGDVLGVDVGLVGWTARDDLLVPLAATGGGVLLGAHYEAVLGSGVLHANLVLTTALGTARHGGLALGVNHAVHAGYLPFLSRSDGWTWALGPAVGWEGDFNYFNAWDDSHAYWIGSRWLGPAVRTWTRVGADWRLDLAGSLGLVGSVARPPEYRTAKQEATGHLGFFFWGPQQGARFAWLGDWQLLRLSAELRSGAGTTGAPAKGWGLGADLKFIHASFPASSVGFELGIRSTWSWGL